jgi:serine/threonine protein kinase
MTASRICAKCGATLSAESALDVCPRCVAAQVLAPQTVPDATDATARPAGTIALEFGSLEQPGDRIGRYKLFQKIGEGGCGVVYMAEQEEPVRRRVALKVIKLGMDTKSVIARFEAERQALAMMDHPNIAKVLDAGATDQGRPYFVMELVRGIKITDYCDQNNLPMAARLDLFTRVCSAIQHAHQKGIIHREIKPSNILVTLHDRVPVPKVIDFGIAKATTDQRLTDKTLFTAFEQFIGTPAYMSPEQAEMSGLDIDTRTDIYALGVLLYELLTGKTPFDPRELMAAGIDEMRRTIREVEPVKPSTRLTQELGRIGTERARVSRASVGFPAAGNDAGCGASEPRAEARSAAVDEASTAARGARALPRSALRTPHAAVPADLDWIVMKCLEKDRTRRYETANGLAADLQRYLENEPVIARPPSAIYKLRKAIRRNKTAFAAGTVVLAALAAGFAVAVGQYAARNRAYERERAEADKASHEAAKSEQVVKFLEDMLGTTSPLVVPGVNASIVRQTLDWASERISKELKNQPAVEAQLRMVLGKAYKQIHEDQKAEAMLRESLAIHRRLHGDRHPELVAPLLELSGVLWTTRRNAEAERLIREALALHHEFSKEKEPQLDEILNLLGLLLASQDKLAEAEQVLGETLALKRKLYGPTNSTVAVALINLGDVFRRQEKLPQAAAAEREALEMVTAALAALPETTNPGELLRLQAGAANNLSYTFEKQGLSSEAEAPRRQALEASKKLYGVGSQEAIGDTRDLVNTFIRQRRFEEKPTG